MYLNVVSSHRCALNHVKVPKTLMKTLNLDYGDWLVFDTSSGLHSAMVVKTDIEDINEHGGHKVFVNKDSPILFGTPNEVFIEPHNLTIGGDPEFFILNGQQNLVEAFKIFSHEGKVGSDGDLGELRPDYALCPEQLVENIGLLMLQLKHRLPKGLIPVASSYLKHRCSGFHIHLGMPIELLSFAADDTDRFFKNLVATLDYLVALPAAALDLEDKRRLSFSYGKPGDYRLSMRTLEYRTPGGFHLSSPAYTKYLLSAAYKVVETTIRETEKISGGWTEMSKITGFNYFKNRYNIPDKNTIYKILTTKNRFRMEEEAKKAVKILKEIMNEYDGNIIETQHESKPLLQEWLEHETKHQTHFYQT